MSYSFAPPAGLGIRPDTGRQRRMARVLEILTEGLPTLPASVFRINRLLNNWPVDLKRAAEVIRQDPSLAAQVLRLTNSAACDMPRRVLSIKDATVQLGTKGLRALVLTCTLIDATGGPSGNDVQAFWQHNLLTALLSERLAQGVGYDSPEQAYVAGLLHDIGTLPLLTIHAEEQTDPAKWEFFSWGESREAEQEYFGMDHCQTGRLVGISWNFPPALIEVFEHHHEPRLATQDRWLVGIVGAADKFSHVGEGFLEAAGQEEGASRRVRGEEILRNYLPALEPGAAEPLLERMKSSLWQFLQMTSNSLGGQFTATRVADEEANEG